MLVLLTHSGSADQLVDPQHSDFLFKGVPSADKRLLIGPDVMHEVWEDVESTRVFVEFATWLDTHFEADRAKFSHGQ